MSKLTLIGDLILQKMSEEDIRAGPPPPPKAREGVSQSQGRSNRLEDPQSGTSGGAAYNWQLEWQQYWQQQQAWQQAWQPPPWGSQNFWPWYQPPRAPWAGMQADIGNQPGGIRSGRNKSNFGEGSKGSGEFPDRRSSVSGDEDQESEEEDRDVDLNFKEKVELAFKILDIVPETDPREDRHLYLRKQKPRAPLLKFPFARLIDEIFQETWDGATRSKNYDWDEEMVAPVGALGEGKRCTAKFQPRYKYYAVQHERSEDKTALWPTKQREVDGNFRSVFNLSQKPKKSNLDDYSDLTGKAVCILNQLVFFGDAIKVVVGSLGEGRELEANSTAVTLQELVDVQTRSFRDLAYTLASLDLSLLLAKREEVLKPCKISEEDKCLLRFAPPKDAEHRLFSGKLNAFESMRAKRDNNKMIAQMGQKGNNMGMNKEPSYRAQGEVTRKGFRKFEGSKKSQPFRSYNWSRREEKKGPKDRKPGPKGGKEKEM